MGNVTGTTPYYDYSGFGSSGDYAGWQKQIFGNYFGPDQKTAKLNPYEAFGYYNDFNSMLKTMELNNGKIGVGSMGELGAQNVRALSGIPSGGYEDWLKTWSKQYGSDWTAIAQKYASYNPYGKGFTQSTGGTQLAGDGSQDWSGVKNYFGQWWNDIGYDPESYDSWWNSLNSTYDAKYGSDAAQKLARFSTIADSPTDYFSMNQDLGPASLQWNLPWEVQGIGDDSGNSQTNPYDRDKEAEEWEKWNRSHGIQDVPPLPDPPSTPGDPKPDVDDIFPGWQDGLPTDWNTWTSKNWAQWFEGQPEEEQSFYRGLGSLRGWAKEGYYNLDPADKAEYEKWITSQADTPSEKLVAKWMAEHGYGLGNDYLYSTNEELQKYIIENVFQAPDKTLKGSDYATDLSDPKYDALKKQAEEGYGRGWERSAYESVISPYAKQYGDFARSLQMQQGKTGLTSGFANQAKQDAKYGLSSQGISALSGIRQQNEDARFQAKGQLEDIGNANSATYLAVDQWNKEYAMQQDQQKLYYQQADAMKKLYEKEKAAGNKEAWMSILQYAPYVLMMLG